jgi:AAA+ superfamily predicted ATPase
MTQPESRFAGGKRTDFSDESSSRFLISLKRLDRLLERATALAQDAFGQEAMADPFRGLYINRDELTRLLARAPGAPLLWSEEEETENSLSQDDAGSSRITWLKQAFGLSSFDLDVMILALAPELDLRYERLYAFLQDDVSRKRPSIDLALNLLCPDAETRLIRRTHFAPDAPLIWHHLIHLIPVPHQDHPPLLAHTLKLDEQTINFLLGHDRLDLRLASFCHMIEPIPASEDLLQSGEAREVLPRLVIQARKRREPLRLYFQGPRGVGKRHAAEIMAGIAGMSLLAADMVFAPIENGDFSQVLRVLFREAWFRGALLFIDHLDVLRTSDRRRTYETFLHQLMSAAGVIIMAGSEPWVPDGSYPSGVITVAFPIPGASQRRAYWQANLEAAGIALKPKDLDALSGRFHLTPSQIDEAFVGAFNRACWRAVETPDDRASALSIGDLFTAARAQNGHDLARLAAHIEPRYRWQDLVLPEDALSQLKEICERVAHRERVMKEWGFEKKLSLGKGTTALFSGSSGTGKTMAAEVIANELGLDLYRIDLSRVVDKYVGETEKNLNRIFTAAENANAILFFDEADALFGKRSEVRDSHDRYANIEISYLFQKMDESEGLAILATNLRENVDGAFMRRLAFTVHFPFPDEASRRRIWASIWPANTPVADDVDFDLLAARFKLSGGNIKNIALAAAFLAAEDGSSVTMAHLLHATRREYQKMGKVLSKEEGLLTAVRVDNRGNE